ncbi:MAG: hypothetical protein H7836_16865 [Magnetococcus sp. YQC-3]
MKQLEKIFRSKNPSPWTTFSIPGHKISSWIRKSHQMQQIQKVVTKTHITWGIFAAEKSVAVDDYFDFGSKISARKSE